LANLSSPSVRTMATDVHRTNLDRFVTSEPSLQPKSNSLLAYAVAQALKNLIPARLEDDYKIDTRSAPLGEGRFGTIRACTHLISGMQAAVKTQYKLHCKRNPVTGKFFEVEAMKALSPPAFQFFNSYETPLKLHIVTERLWGPSVFKYLDEKGWEKPRNDREERECAKLVARLLRGISLAHRAGYAHLDVKFENFMYRTSNDVHTGADPVLIDYGGARPLAGPRTLNDVVGSPSYAAPEVVLKGRFSDKSDSWSLGVMAFTILQGFFPLECVDGRINDYNVYFCPLEWRRISAEAQDFVRRLLKTDPRERMSINQALEHPWIVRAEEKFSSNNNSAAPNSPPQATAVL